MKFINTTSAASPAEADSAVHSDTSLALVLALNGLVWLAAAQWQLQAQRLTLFSGAALLLGWAAWIVALKRYPPRSEVAAVVLEQPHAVRWSLLGVTGALVAVVWLTTLGDRYTALNVAAWIAAVAAWLWAWQPATPSYAEPSSGAWSERWLTLLALSGIVGIGAFFRFYRLAEVPLDPTSDHAEKLLDVLDLVNGQRPIFFPRNTGREPGQFYITFGLMRLFDLPLKFETLKFGTALIGVLAIPAVYLLAQELAGRAAGLIAAALYAVAEWPTNTARMGLRFPYAPLPTALMLFFLFRYLRRGDRRDALLCGLVIGLGLHGYISFRIVPLLVPLLFGFAWLIEQRWRSQRRRLITDGGLIVLTAVVTCLPLLHYTLRHPDQVWYRVATRAASTERALGGLVDLLGTFIVNNWNAVLAFNWRGDSTLVNAVRFAPFLDVLTGAALLAGVVLVAYQVVVRRSPRYVSIVVCLPVLCLPSTLSLAFPIENPSVNRIGTVAPLIFTIAALPLAYIARQFWHGLSSATDSVAPRRLLVARLAAVVLVGLFVAGAWRQNYQRYFGPYDDQYNAFVPNVHEIVRAVETEQATYNIPLDQVYLLSYPYWLDGRNLALALGDIGWQPEHDLTDERPLPPRSVGQPLLFILHREDVERRAELTATFPDGVIKHVPSELLGKDFVLFRVPAQ